MIENSRFPSIDMNNAFSIKYSKDFFGVRVFTALLSININPINIVIVCTYRLNLTYAPDPMAEVKAEVLPF